MLGGNSAPLYGVEPRAAAASILGDRIAAARSAYLAAGPEPSHLRHGYVEPSVFA
jgi:hypothetical protein